ncbi:Phage head-tail joining protein [Tautonia plasticadhaerens]|uniref:Phage head-tail joining protein n=1 Tax=Tautonia plasticadhaerens TaxID=2527974 RepID=A0A518H253_9BACT|nr:Phage head-tail joining protein [Tautonia plasticadhaerens]
MNCTNAMSRMNKRVTLQSLTQTEDGQGGFTDSWGNVASTWAEIMPMKGYERMQAMQLQTPLTHKVMIRYRAGVTNAMRLLYGERVLHIKEVINENEEGRFLRLLCVEKNPVS